MNECKYCHAPLEGTEEVHAMYGNLFCSKECAIAYRKQCIIRDLDLVAREDYEEAAEVVSTKDILPDEPLYHVTIREVLKKVIPVRAKDADEALSKVEADWNDSKIVLDASDFDRVDFRATEVPDEQDC